MVDEIDERVKAAKDEASTQDDPALIEVPDQSVQGRIRNHDECRAEKDCDGKGREDTQAVEW
jgi:hypothetical protein